MRNRSPRWILVLLTAVLLAGCGATPSTTARSSASSAASAAAPSGEPRNVIDPPKQLIDWDMPSNTGENVKLSDFRGKPVLLFFGYTHCPDYCPTTLGEFKQIKKQLGEQGDDVGYVFISVDGERDTPDVLDRYVKTFDPSFVGVQGTSATLQPIAKDYGLYAKKNTEAGSASGYLVDHSVVTYVIDKQGRLRVFFPAGVQPTTIAADVETLLKEPDVAMTNDIGTP